MLTYQELLFEIKRRSPGERLALLEDLVHFLREELANSTTSKASQPPTPEDLGWPPGYFEETYGSQRDDPLERAPQGQFEVRERMH